MQQQDLNSLAPLNPELVQEKLNQWPFVKIDGVSNARTLGPYPTGPSETADDRKITRPFHLFRSAEVSGITEEGKKQMKELGIRRVYDLRSDTEIEKYNTPVPYIDGIDVIRIPVFQNEDYSPEAMAHRFQLYTSGKTEAFMELYCQILDHGALSVAEIAKHVRDYPEQGCLFHCTAGKDRTAVVAAILLSLAGVPDDHVADDYELTRIGREPIREKILARLAIEPIFAANKDAALNMLTSRRETILAFLDLLRDKYGGAEGYLQNHCHLSIEDIRTIRNNLLTNKPS